MSAAKKIRFLTNPTEVKLTVRAAAVLLASPVLLKRYDIRKTVDFLTPRRRVKPKKQLSRDRVIDLCHRVMNGLAKVAFKPNCLRRNLLMYHCLRRHGADEESITVVYCPGAYEIPQVALQMARSGKFTSVITLGCVIRGDTPHFTYIASEVAKGVAQVALETDVPTSFGVLTVDTLEQALERAGAKGGNKGWDAALTALELTSLRQQLQKKGHSSRGR